MSTLLIATAFLGMIQAPGAPAAAGTLPVGWLGSWAGQLTVHGPNGTFQRGMELHITASAAGKPYGWKMVSEFRGKTTVREYELIPEPDKPGQFRIDEKNGIILDARLIGDALYCYYQDGPILITTRYELRGDRLHMEMISTDTKQPRVSVIKEAGMEIRSYLVGSVQSGELKKKK